MFNFFYRIFLLRAIRNTCMLFKNQFKEDIINSLSQLNDSSEEELEEVVATVNRKFFFDVANTLFQGSTDTPNIRARIQLARSSPSLCGYEGMDTTNTLIAGNVYAILYWAVTNSVASSKDCIKANHIQRDIMNDALADLDKLNLQ